MLFVQFPTAIRNISFSEKRSTARQRVNLSFVEWAPSVAIPIEFLHQTTTRDAEICRHERLYLIEFLHQTTTQEAAYHVKYQ